MQAAGLDPRCRQPGGQPKTCWRKGDGGVAFSEARLNHIRSKATALPVQPFLPAPARGPAAIARSKEYSARLGEPPEGFLTFNLSKRFTNAQPITTRICRIIAHV